MAHKAQNVARRTESARVDPAVIERRVFGDAFRRIELAAPNTWLRRGTVDVGHEGAKDATLEVGAAGSDESTVGMPVEAKSR